MLHTCLYQVYIDKVEMLQTWLCSVYTDKVEMLQTCLHLMYSDNVEMLQTCLYLLPKQFASDFKKLKRLQLSVALILRSKCVNSKRFTPK